MFLSAKVGGVDGNVIVRRNEIADGYITLLPHQSDTVGGFEWNVRHGR